MPQLSLSIDEETFRKIENGAMRSNITVSRYVLNALNEHFTKKWPESFIDSFGSISDGSFKEPGDMSFDMDIQRERL
ncbi:MAG: hypothetical protein LBS19_06370 [Clostridiales bacterium]|jgi:hypothetical protein|nr:hypothetical protein [Clostridiales bacterium]